MRSLPCLLLLLGGLAGCPSPDDTGTDTDPDSDSDTDTD